MFFGKKYTNIYCFFSKKYYGKFELLYFFSKTYFNSFCGKKLFAQLFQDQSSWPSLTIDAIRFTTVQPKWRQVKWVYVAPCRLYGWKLTVSIIQGDQCLALRFEEKTSTPMIIEEGKRKLFFYFSFIPTHEFTTQARLSHHPFDISFSLQKC